MCGASASSARTQGPGVGMLQSSGRSRWFHRALPPSLVRQHPRTLSAGRSRNPPSNGVAARATQQKDGPGGGTWGDACNDHARRAHALENLWRRARLARAGTGAFRYFGWPGPGLRREQGSTSMSAMGEGHRRYHGVTLKKGHTAEPGPRRGRILRQCWQEANAAHIGQGQSPPRWGCTGLLKGSQ
jgi:hypothetical protein